MMNERALKHWRRIHRSDLPAISALSNVIWPVEYREDAGVFEERFALFPEGCFCLETQSGIGGYCIAHPWIRGSFPSLNSRLAEVPDTPTTYFLHDIAVLESLRGSGRAAAAVALQLAVAARCRLDHVSLVSVLQSEAFWSKMGFVEMPDGEKQKQARNKYGNGASLMERSLGAG